MIPKFRTFIKIKNEINPIQPVGAINFESETITIEQGLTFPFDKAILMQYTGLKDKNGVEIYEGDIVKRTHLFNGGYGETHTGEVFYDNEYARYVISRPQKHIEPKTEDLRNTLSDRSTYEVIGDVFENPDLLG